MFSFQQNITKCTKKEKTQEKSWSEGTKQSLKPDSDMAHILELLD